MKIKIEGVHPYNGTYDLPLETEMLSTNEFGWVKRAADVYPVDILDALSKGDAEVITMLGVCALVRSGRVEADTYPEAKLVYDRLASAPFGSAVTLDLETEEAAEEPIPPPSPASSTENGVSSSPASTPSLEMSDSLPPASGMPASDTSLFAQGTSGG